MKTNFTKRRFRAPKRSSCALCKPHKKGGEDKQTIGDLRQAAKHEQEIHEADDSVY